MHTELASEVLHTERSSAESEIQVWQSGGCVRDRVQCVRCSSLHAVVVVQDHLLVPRGQFVMIELARNKEGHNHNLRAQRTASLAVHLAEMVVQPEFAAEAVEVFRGAHWSSLCTSMPLPHLLVYCSLHMVSGACCCRLMSSAESQ